MSFIENTESEIQKISEKIKNLAKEKNRIIFAHTYQIPEIQNIADYVGDSFYLAKLGKTLNEKDIVLCGVFFMAESIKILSPEKHVFIPDIEAGCPMADMITADKVRELKEKKPESPVVCYVNSSAEVKAESDVCCTSANVINVINKIHSKNIIFIPDKMLGSFAAEKTNKNILLYNGFCPVHQGFNIQKISTMKKETGALVLAHGETSPELRKIADKILSTSQMINYVKENNKERYIICTEEGIKTQLKKYIPEENFHIFTEIYCKNMKRITLIKLLDSLKYDQYEVFVDEEIRKKAYRALNRMLDLSA